MNTLIHSTTNTPSTTDKGASEMQSERIFQREDGRWYFRIRGDTSMGPYSSHREASESMNRYVASCRRQSEMSFTWPRWLHVRHLARRVNDVQTAAPKPQKA